MSTEARRRIFVLIAVILGSSIVVLDGTIVNLALPKIGGQLHVGFSALQWVVDGYALSLSALILLGGSLGDIFGRKKVYLIGLIGFGIASLLCGVAPNATLLVISRILQGVGGALLVPGALSIINTNFPREERGKAIGRWTAWISISTVIGPLAGGIILDLVSWRWIFLVNIPFVIACYVLGHVFVKEGKDPSAHHIDAWGALLGAAALAFITFGLIQGPANHWSASSVVSLVLGVMSAIGFIWYEARARYPMVPLALFTSRNFSGSNLMTFAMYGALSGFTFALSIYVQTRMGYSSLKAGFSLLPVSIIMFLFAGRVGDLSATYGPRRFMTVGPLIMAVGVAYLYFLRPGSSYIVGMLPGVILFGAGLALTVAPLTTTVMSSVEDARSGIASGINNAVSRAAGLIIVAVLGLFGSAHSYDFAILLCAGLLVFSGVISFVLIQKVNLTKKEQSVEPHL